MSHRVGKHSFSIEGDVVVVTYVGGVSLDEMKQMTVLSDPVLLLPSIYMIYDVTEAGLMSPEARRYAAERSKVLRVVAMLIYGTNAFTRAAIALVMATVRLLGKDIPRTIYVSDEEAARAWIAADRKNRSPG